MGGESWCTIKDLHAPFPVLKTGHVDHLLVHVCAYFSKMYIIGVFLFYILYFFIFSKLIEVVLSTFSTVLTYFSKLLKLRFFMPTLCTYLYIL